MKVNRPPSSWVRISGAEDEWNGVRDDDEEHVETYWHKQTNEQTNKTNKQNAQELHVWKVEAPWSSNVLRATMEPHDHSVY